MTRRTARDFFDAYAPAFDHLYGRPHRGPARLINRYLRKSMRLRFERCLECCAPIQGKRVLDVGCGPGHYGIALARLGAAEVLGIDFAPGMIELAARNVASAGVVDRCRFVQSDFLEFVSDDRFDYVLAMGLMDYVREPEPVVARAMALATRRALFSFPAAEGFLAWQRRLRYVWKTDLYLYDGPRLRRMFAALAPGRARIERLARDYFVSVEL